MPIADVPTLSSVSDKIQFLKRKTEVYLDRLRFIVSEVIVDKIGVVNYIDLDVRLHLIDKIKKKCCHAKSNALKQSKLPHPHFLKVMYIFS